MNIAGATSLEGFICPACFVDFPGAAKLEEHWLKFHSPKGSAVLSGRDSNDYEEIPEDLPPSGNSQINSAGTQPCNHVFRSDLLAVLEKCGICGNVIEDEGSMCQGCNFCCHKKCESMVKGQGFRTASVNSTHSKYKSMVDDELGRKSRAPPSPKNLVTNICHHMRHRVSRNRVRHVDEHFDLDLTYITDRIIAMSFPGSGLETTYRNNLREVARMLQTNHQDKYMVFNLSERRYDISKLNNQVLDFGWPDHFAPPLERLCSIIKSIDSWLKTDKQHVVVVHCKGGKGRTGVVIAAYMHFSKICSSPKEALDWFAMKRFYDDSLGGVTQPSQRRYVHYFSDYLDGKIKLNTDPIFLHHVIIHGIPSFDAKDGCKPFLRVYDGLKLIYTSGVFHVTSDMERICITIEGGLILHGDILIKCYHKNTLSSGRDVIFRCQFHTGAVKDQGLVLDKTELDDSCKDRRFPDNCKVEFVFSSTGNLISEIKDNERLQSIIKRHSLQPVENPDTVLYPSLESWYDSSGSVASSVAPERRTTEPDFKKSDYLDRDNKGSTLNAEPSATLKRPPVYVAGPVNGHLYAQVDKAFIKKVRSLSLDSGVRTKSGEELGFFEHRANTLNRRKAYGFENKENVPSRLKHPDLQYTVDRMQQSNSVAVSDEEITHKIKSIDKLLQELGECTDLLDSTLQQPKPNVKNIDTHGKNSTAAPSGKSPPGPPKRKAASFDAGERYLNRMIAGSVRTNEPNPQNGVGSLRRTSPRGTNFESASSRNPLPLQPLSPTDASSSSSRADRVQNDFLSAPNKGEQIQLTTSCILHDAPIPQASPPMSPKFYATQMTPRTFKASTFAETVEYNSNHPGQNRILNNSSSFTYGGLGAASDAFVSNGRFVDGYSATGDWKFASRATSNDDSPFDFNNNKSATNLDLRDFEEQKIIEDSHTLPEKGNVASKIALLTDMFQPGNLHLPPHQTVKGTLVPMPGLTSVSPAEVFKEIASYNAKSLAPGELSHSSGTLYITGSPPTRIVERTRHARQEFDKDDLHQSHLAPTHAYVLPKTDLSDRIIDKSPSSSVDGLSLDEGVESKGSTDETTTLGMSPSASSDGHTDSAFGESIFSSSSVFTPVGSSNRFNPAASATANQDLEVAEGLLSQSDSDLLEQAAAYVRGAREDDEAGYARLEDVREAKTSGRQASGISTETQTTLEGTSPLDTPRVGGSMEEIKPDHVNDDVEAINDILTEIADMSTLDIPEPSQLSRSSTPQSFNSGGTGLTPRSPVFSSGSGSFENASERTKSHPHSDKGYSSTTSVSSGSSGDNVFLPDSPKVPGLKFDRDTSSFWYKPTITRDDAIALLRNKDPGSFIIRDSQSFPGAFGLAVKVAVPPAHVLQGLQGDMTKFDLVNELVRHFLIESTKRGVRLKGCSEEPVFGSLAAFVYQHSITPLALPIRLSMPLQDPFQADKAQSVEKEDEQSWPRGAVGSLMYLGQSDVEMLTGTSAIQRTIENLSTEEAAKKFTTVSFKVSPQGMTVTDNERKVFFRQHFPMKSILHCGIDPGDKRWELKTPTYSGKSKSFGIVLRKMGGVHNECHLFGEISKDWPSSILVNIVNRFMTPAT